MDNILREFFESSDSTEEWDESERKKNLRQISRSGFIKTSGKMVTLLPVQKFHIESSKMVVQ